MQWHGIKIPIVILALLLGLGTLWGGQWLFNRYNYERPLSNLLGENKDVISYSINDSGPLLEVEVRLKKVESLENSYVKLRKSVEEVAGGRKIKITVKDDRDQTLEGVYQDASLAAYEALTRGNYLDMGRFIEARAAGQGAQAKVFLDGEHLYIQMQHEDKYLYEIIPRTDQTNGLNLASGEGGRST